MRAKATTNKEFLESFEAIDEKKLQDTELPNKNFEEGVVENLIALAVTEYEFKEGTKKVVIFEDKEGLQHYNGNSFVVNAIDRIPALPCPVRIVCTGTQKGANGNYKTFSIKTLK